MKFGSVLAATCQSMPEFESMLLRYKQLKKQLKNLVAGSKVASNTSTMDTSQAPEASTSALAPGSAERAAKGVLAPEEVEFINTLNADVARFNRFFMEREEEAVIQLQALEERLASSKTAEQTAAVRARLVDFHGSCVLLLHWSMFNYTAIVKVLKKHDKHSGVLLRAPYLANLLQQPFSSTSIMSGLVHKAETLLTNSMPEGQATAAVGEEGGVQGQQEQQQQQQGQLKQQGQQQPAAMQELQQQGSLQLQQKLQQREAAVQPAEEQVKALAGPGRADSSDEDVSCLTLDNVLCRRTQLALQTWETLTHTARTPSTLVPPHFSGVASAANSQQQAGSHSLTPSGITRVRTQPVVPVGAVGVRPLPPAGGSPPSPIHWDPFDRSLWSRPAGGSSVTVSLEGEEGGEEGTSDAAVVSVQAGQPASVGSPADDSQSPARSAKRSRLSA